MVENEKITFEDFKKLDIRIGRIKSAEPIENADKLLKLTLDMGDEERIVVAGVAEWYKTDELVGLQIPVLVNLEPRTLRGVESQGMMLAASAEGKAVLLRPDKEVPPGSIIR